MKQVLPGLGEVGPVGHHPPAEFLFGRRISDGPSSGPYTRVSQHVAEREENLVAVHHSHPAGPRVGGVRLAEEVRVDGEAGVRVRRRERVERTDEVAVADRGIQGGQVPETVVQRRGRPVRVLETDGVHAEAGVQLVPVLRVVEKERVERYLVLLARQHRPIARWNLERHPRPTGGHLQHNTHELRYTAIIQKVQILLRINKKGKGSPYSITERRVPELIPVLCSQPAGDVSHKPCGRLPLLSARPAVTIATLERAATNFAA